MHHFAKRPLVDRELTLRDMLDDPIVQDVMRRDGVQRWQGNSCLNPYVP